MAVIRRRANTTWSMKTIPMIRLVLVIFACALVAAYVPLFGSSNSDTMLRGLQQLQLQLIAEEGLQRAGGGIPTALSSNKYPLQVKTEARDTKHQALEKSTGKQSGKTRDSEGHLSSASSKPEAPGLAIILFAHLKNTDRFDNLIFPALDTWWSMSIPTEPLYIVLTPQWKENYATMCQENAGYCSRLYPLWVDCPEGQFGESPCCKQEKGLLALPKDYEWTLFADDDMYFKVDVLMGLLQNHLPDASKEVYIVTAGGKSPKQLGQFGYKGIRSPYKCSELPDYRYPWGQPVIYSRAALTLVKPGLRAGGLVKQCIEFNLTHDAGNSIFHWMYQLPDYALRVSMFPSYKTPREVFGVHGIHRYIESIGHVVTMQEVHEQVLNSTKKMTYKKYMTIVNNRTGFLESETFANYGDPSTWSNDEWHTMPVRDCMDKHMKRELDI